MSLSNATVTMNLSDMLGTDFDTRRTKIWVTTNVDGDTVVDTVGDAIRLGSGVVTLNSDGTGTIVVWVPGTGSNPATWQTTIHVDYPDAGSRSRKVRAFGPFTITASANLADLIAEQDVPPTYLSGAVATLEALIAEAEAAAGSGGGSGTIPVTSANSSTAYTVTAPAHGEKRVKLTLTGNATLTLSGGTAAEACAVQLSLIQDATGSRTVTWPTNVDWGLNGPPVLSSVTGKTDQVYLLTDDAGASWQGALIGNGYNSPVVPSAPTGVAANVVSSQVQLDWTQGAANGSTVTQNKIYRGTVSGSLTLLTTISAATTYTDAAVLTDGTTYYYKVAAVNAVGTGTQSSQVSAVPGLTVVAADNFTRSNTTATTPSNGLIGQTTPTGTKTWLNLTASGLWDVSSNAAVCSNSLRYLGIDSGVSNCTVSGRIATPGAAADHGLLFRWTDASNYCIVIVDSGGYYIQKVIGGTPTNIDHGGGSLGSNLTTDVKVVLNGSTVTCFADGVQVATGTIADAVVLTATKHGFATGSNASVTFDNFQVTTP